MYKFKPRTTRGHGGGHATELAGGITINGDMGKYFEKKIANMYLLLICQITGSYCVNFRANKEIPSDL